MIVRLRLCHFPGLFSIFLLAACAGQSVRTPMAAGSASERKPRNVILFIGDGMGIAQVAAGAAQLYGQERDADGNPGRLAFERFPAFGYLTTFSASSFVTDSAAGGTALACGQKTKNGVLGQTVDGTRLQSEAELAYQQGKAVGILTSVGIDHATPASFYAHIDDRDKYDEILAQFLQAGTFDVLMGGGLNTKTWTDDKIRAAAADKEYKVFTCDNLDQLTPDNIGAAKVLGYFDLNGDHQLDFEATRSADNREPHLSDLTMKALEILKRDPDGFFLMVEGGSIDWACHSNKSKEEIGEMLEFNRTIERAVEWLRQAGQFDDTLIIVTADHETGGLGLNGPYGKTLPAGQEPEIKFTSTNHTAIPVGVWASGPGSEALIGKHDNTFVNRVIVRALE